MRIFHLFCILICAYSISILIDERYEVAYASVNRSEPFHWIACIDLRSILPSYGNQTEVPLDQLNKDVYRFFSTIKARQRKEHLRDVIETLFLGPIRSKKYFIHLDQICMPVDHQPNYYYLNIDSMKFLYKQETRDFYRVTDFLEKLDQLVVEHRERPYSNCKKGFSMSECLNECFKRKNRLSKYYYDARETGTIDFADSKSWESVRVDEDKCFEQCKGTKNCKMTYFTPILNNKENKTSYAEAYPLLSEADFWFQLVGLFCLILAISLLRLVSLLVRLIGLQTSRYFFIWRVNIFLLILACSLYLTYYQTVTYLEKLNNRVKKETTTRLFEAQQFSLVFCILMGEPIGKTLLEVEKETNSLFENTVDEISLVFQNKRLPINWTLSTKVLFFRRFRCFRVEVFPQEPRYQLLLSISKVTMKLVKNRVCAMYLLGKEQDFVPNALHYHKDMNVAKWMIKRSNHNGSCVDYAEIRSNCNTRACCANACSDRTFYQKFRNVSLQRQVVVDKDNYSPAEWAGSFLIRTIGEHEPIRQRCEEEFSKREPDCLEVYFENSVGNQRLYSTAVNSNEKSIDLSYELVSSVEEEPSGYKLLLDILTTQSILFGFTVFGSLKMLYGLAKSKLKLKRGKKTGSILIYLICSAGCLYQVVHIVNEMNAELIRSQHFVMLKSMKVPELVFCLEIRNFQAKLNASKRAGKRLTGMHLNEITSELRVETVFQRVSYLNETNSWNELELSSSNFDFFYFANKKCFVVKLNREYRRRQFYFQHKTEILRIYLRKENTEHMNQVHFMTRKGFQLSQIMSLSFFSRVIYYSISHELFEINYQDKFNFIRNPLLLFPSNELNNADRYLRQLIENFRSSSNSCTLNLPLEREHFDLEIDDDRFESYFRDVQNVSDHNGPVNPNYQREIAINYLHTNSHTPSEPHFMFSLIFFKRITGLTNESGFAALILNLLNTLSFWFNFHTLDIFLNIYKIAAMLSRSPNRSRRRIYPAGEKK